MIHQPSHSARPSGRSFQNQVVIITGASSGIGEELAYQLATQQARLVLASPETEKLEAVASRCREQGGEALIVPTDVSDRYQCQQLIQQTIATYGRIDTLINNAGITMYSTVEEIEDIHLLEHLMQVNYLGSAYCTYYALPFLKQTDGRVAAVASVAALNGVPTRSGYVASKHAMMGFFDSLRIELMNSGVSITVLFPDIVATGIHAHVIGSDGQPHDVSHTVNYQKAMTTKVCAAQMLRAIASRKRQLMMSNRAQVGRWVKLLIPALTDRIAKRAVTATADQNQEVNQQCPA
ncbi:SDR family oxidoreductase [Cyanobacteria bacterium FACHB-63]|nr:SDR family oxidoreductase [Cyanobacteria bacterium FACHB-63]